MAFTDRGTLWWFISSKLKGLFVEISDYNKIFGIMVNPLEFDW
jgi:hypothetical protein